MTGITPSKSVGAGLLANTECQSTYPVTDTPYSRASPLQHLTALLLRNQLNSSHIGA